VSCQKVTSTVLIVSTVVLDRSEREEGLAIFCADSHAAGCSTLGMPDYADALSVAPLGRDVR